jgi:hypothetical protein
MLPTKIQFIWPRGCRREDFFVIDKSETGIAYGAMNINGLGRIVQFLIEERVRNYSPPGTPKWYILRPGGQN